MATKRTDIVDEMKRPIKTGSGTMIIPDDRNFSKMRYGRVTLSRDSVNFMEKIGLREIFSPYEREIRAAIGEGKDWHDKYTIANDVIKFLADQGEIEQDTLKFLYFHFGRMKDNYAPLEVRAYVVETYSS